MTDNNHILFITSSRIGDAVLSTGILNHLVKTIDNPKVTVACGPLSVSLFEGLPYLEEIIPLQKQKHNKHWIGLWKRTIGKRWHSVVDMRNSAVSRLVFAKRRYIFGKSIDRSLHKVEQAARVLRLEDGVVPSPCLWPSDLQMQTARTLFSAHDGEKILGVGPTANWAGKTWPVENYIDVLRWMISDGGVMSGADVAVFAAPGEEDDAWKVLQSLPDGRGIDVIAKTDPGTAAAALGLCDFYIGNDSGLMHCAAAAGVRTLGLFGPSYPHLYRPWGENADYISTPETFDELIDFEGYKSSEVGSLMTTLTVEMVKDKLQEMF